VPPRGAPFGASARRPRGAAWVSFLLLFALVAAAYLAWVWMPVYADHYAAKQATRDFMNRAVKDRNDSELVAGLSTALAHIRKQRVTDESGTVWDLPAVDVPPESISWVRDTSSKPPMLRVSYEYERSVYFPFLDRSTVAHFAVELENDLTVPQWD
jgi:hypothetical protein